MADSKLTDLTELTETADGDLLYVADVSAAASGSRRWPLSSLWSWITAKIAAATGIIPPGALASAAKTVEFKIFCPGVFQAAIDACQALNNFNFIYQGPTIAVNQVILSVGAASSSGTRPTVDVKPNGTSILSTPATIPSTAHSRITLISGYGLSATHTLIESGEWVQLTTTQGSLGADEDAADLLVTITGVIQ